MQTSPDSIVPFEIPQGKYKADDPAEVAEFLRWAEEVYDSETRDLAAQCLASAAPGTMFDDINLALAAHAHLHRAEIASLGSIKTNSRLLLE
jgi:hypothetical protein